MCSSGYLTRRRKVIKFIDKITEKYPKEMRDVFSNGYCFWFALILKERFHGTIWFNPLLVHFAANIDNRLFDVNGVIDDAYGWESWDDYQRKHWYEASQIVTSVIKKV